MLNSDLITSVSDYNLNSALLDNGGTTPKQETSKSKSNNLSKVISIVGLFAQFFCVASMER